MSKKLFIHIGPPKTGTSALQWFLHSQRDSIVNEGILYPEDDAHNWWSHRRLGFALRQKLDPKNDEVPDFQVTLAEILAQVERSDAGTIILSSEEFFLLKADAVNRLLNSFSDFDTRIVLYARRQDDAYISSFTQKVKMPRRHFTEPAQAFLNTPTRMSKGLDYYRRASIWSKKLGKDRLVVRLYDEVEDIRADFMSLLGNDKLVKLALQTQAESSNISPSLEAIEHIRAFKAAVKERNLYAPATTVLTEHFAAGQRPGDLLSTDDRRHILEFFRPSNEKFFAEFLGMENRFDPDLLLRDSSKERVVIDTSNTVALVNELLTKRREARMAAKSDASPLGKLISAIPGLSGRD